MILALLVVGCGGPDAGPVPITTAPDTGDESTPVGLEEADPARLLRRMSLDLRGVLPTTEELDAVVEDPEQIDALRDAYLADPRLEERIVGMLSERWHTRIDEHDVLYYDYDLTDADHGSFVRAVGEEPLRLAARIAVSDRSWTEITTADTTMANEMLGELWPIDYPEGETGWQEVHYTDQRPPAGVLATNGLWWRYNTGNFNLSRSRAAATVRLMLCEDLLARPVSFSATPSLLEQEQSLDAVQEQEACLSCHAAIEPLAATFFGFFPTVQYNVRELDTYHPEREPQGEALLGVESAWFGQPVSGLAEVGVRVSADPRFDRCAAETAATVLWRRPVVTGDFDRIDALREDFIASDRRWIALLRAVTDTPEYRAGSLSADATAETEARERTIRMLPPDVLASVVEDATGFRWTTEGWDQLSNDYMGYRIMTGGVDGERALHPQSEPGLTWTLVIARLAELAAGTVADAHFEEGEADTLLAGVSADLDVDDPAFDATLDSLSWALLAEPHDADRNALLTELWVEVEAADGVPAAWGAVLTALLRDPLFVAS